MAVEVRCSILMVNTECDLLDWSFMFVEATLRTAFP